MSARAAWAVGAIGTLVAIVFSVLSLSGDRGAPGSSLDATTGRGLSGLAALLAANGHAVTSDSSGASGASLSGHTTLLMLRSNSVSGADLGALRQFLGEGGNLVVAGPAPWMGSLVPDPPVAEPSAATRAGPLVPVPEDNHVQTVVTDGAVRWGPVGATLPAIGSQGGTLLALATVGRGRVAMLADPTPLQNELLTRGDDAALGLALAGERNRPVVFVDAEGTGGSGGLAALPNRWKWLLGGLLLSALVLIAARGRRLGEPDATQLQTPPPRAEHVEVVARALGASVDARRAGAIVGRAARDGVLRRAGLPQTASAAEIDRAATRLGLDELERRMLAADPVDESEMLAAGSALAKLTAERSLSADAPTGVRSTTAIRELV